MQLRRQEAILDALTSCRLALSASSGSCLIAAHKTGRICRGVELDPLYVGVIVRRYEAATGNDAVLIETGEPFKELRCEAQVRVLAARTRNLWSSNIPEWGEFSEDFKGFFRSAIRRFESSRPRQAVLFSTADPPLDIEARNTTLPLCGRGMLPVALRV
jgi:hypothetical protein